MNGMNKKPMRVVRGNTLRIAVPLKLCTVEVIDGAVSRTDIDFSPSQDYPVNIVLSDNAKTYKFVARMINSHTAYVEDLGTIDVGSYAITVLCRDDQGNRYRFKERNVLKVVDCTCEACPCGSGMDAETVFLDSAVFFASGAADRGIDHIDTRVEGNTTTVTFYLTDGSTESFSVKSGIEMIVDQDWDIQSERAIANKVVTGFHDYVMGKESYVSGETLNIEW